MDRRSFLITCAAGAFAGCATGGNSLPSSSREDLVMTVTGPISPDRMGRTLPHEHVLVDFVGAEQVSRDRYEREEVQQIVEPYLQEVASHGCRTLVECTPDYLGRDAELLRQLSERTNLQILTNTGYYGANNDKHVPGHAYDETADQLAERWIEEWEQGIEDTGIRPGFIKIGVDSGPLSAIDEKLVRAACRTHLETGLTIAAHTGPAVPAFEELAVLEDEGVSPEAWIWVHAQNESDLSRHLEAARRGAWVEFDGYSPDRTDRYVEMISRMNDHDLLDRVLVSQDNGWYAVGEPDGGQFQPYHELFTELIPALKRRGFTNQNVEQLLDTNPRNAFTVRVRSQTVGS